MGRVIGWIGIVLLAGIALVALSLGSVYLEQVMARGGAFGPELRGVEWQRRAQTAMSELFPTRTVSRGGPIAAFAPAPVDLDALPVPDAGGSRIDAELRENHTRGIVVLHEGRLVYERYFDAAGPRTRFTSWSVAKSITATLIGLLRDEGKIASFDDPIERYLEGLEGTGYAGVTIRQILQMTSGVAFTEEYTDEVSDVARFMAFSVIGQLQPADLVAASHPRGFDPGTRFNYNTAETQILGQLVRELSGMSHAAYLEDRLWARLGMEHDATVLLDRPGPAGVAMAGCCLNATLRDWARFGQLYLEDGVWRGERLLPEGFVAEATSHANSWKLEEDGVEEGYGYQWWTFADGTYAAEGVHGQFVFVDPANRVVIAKASGWPDAWTEERARAAFATFRAIAAHLGAAPVETAGG